MAVEGRRTACGSAPTITRWCAWRADDLLDARLADAGPPVTSTMRPAPPSPAAGSIAEPCRLARRPTNVTAPAAITSICRHSAAPTQTRPARSVRGSQTFLDLSSVKFSRVSGAYSKVDDRTEHRTDRHQSDRTDADLIASGAMSAGVANSITRAEEIRRPAVTGRPDRWWGRAPSHRCWSPRWR